MPVPTAITDLSTTAASNYPAGTEAPNVIDDTLRAHAAFIAQLRDGPHTLFAGSVTAPAYSFSSDANSGWYQISDNSLGLATNGVLRLSVDTTSLVPTLPVQGQDFSAGAPTYAFASDPDTGIFRAGANKLGISTGGVERASFEAAGPILALSGTAPALGSNSTLSVELASDTSLKFVVRGSDGVTRSATVTLA
jgi:hypothetical protein